ncbi:MAG: thioredoxin domain-containing protein [Wenzhouxiangellaceae bacterium]
MSNRLADSLSPYLEQHADNPVDWWPWCPEAIDAARTADRPILLSIGYSACHWCHVMAHESFENEAIARRMNEGFINIKVDREERPDLDRIYQLAHQLLTQRGGGWPLTMFLDPADLTPFVAGTYFPPEARHGLIGFGELLERVGQAWREQRDQVKSQNRQLSDALNMLSRGRGAKAEGGNPAEALIGQLAARRDTRHGGFGSAPKFPQAPLLQWLSDRADSDEQAAEMLDDALRAMAENGLFDHLAGGFFRYCVDAAWEIPHFEKMLADNAQLLPLYAEAAVRWGRAEYRRTTELTAQFLADGMLLEEGGLATSLDADSLPEDAEPDAQPAEGEHYLWQREQFEETLDSPLLDLAMARFGLDGPANFEGRWHLVLARSVDELTDPAHDAAQVLDRLEQAREKLLTTRHKRPAPGRDDKMLAGLNALAASGLLRAGRLLQRPEWTELGSRTLEQVWQRCFASEPHHAVWRDGRSGHPALLDDYAATLIAALARLQSDWDEVWLDRAQDLAGWISERFHDTEAGCLRLTPHLHEALPVRPGANLDDATPAGAGLAVLGLLQLGHLIGDSQSLALASDLLEGSAGDLEQTPMAHATLLRARAEAESPRAQVLIGGAGEQPADWHARLSRRIDLVCYRIPANGMDLPGPLAAIAGSDAARAVVCRGTHCLAPVEDFDALIQSLDASQ